MLLKKKQGQPLEAGGRIRRTDVDMTEGNITRHIITFAIPLLLGNVFQQLYNMVDTWVVGNFVSNEAYSAVGSVGPICNMLIGFFLGLASGAGVVISQFYGAGRHQEVKDTVHTSILLTGIMTLVFMVVGNLMTPAMLKLMNTPAEVFPESERYLRIYFTGVGGLMFYNIGSGILRAVGDSRRPFYFLVVSALLNVALDLLFVIVFEMGVSGVALATVISQVVSALLTLIALMRNSSCVKLQLLRLKLHWNMLLKICKVGIPAALQMTVTSFSNVFVQSYINFFGADCMSGWTTYSKVDQLIFLPMQSIALASTTFVGQNLGKNQPQRARQGVRSSLLIALASTAVMMIPIIIFAPHIVKFFNAKPEVVEFGTVFLHWITPFYILCVFNQVYSGALRGAGNSKMPMIIMLISFVAFRQVYLFVMSRVCNEILPIAMGYPAGWLLSAILTAVYYHTVKLSKSRLIDDD